MRYLKIVFLILMFSGRCVAGSGLHFAEEDLTFELHDSVFSVQGIYYFHADYTGSYAILYPVPVEDSFSKAYDFRVADAGTGKPIDFTVRKDSAAITFRIKGEGDIPILISYKHRLYANHAHYILMSTHSWNEALKRVEYKLKLEPDRTMSWCSIPYDLKVPVDGDTLYLWQRENFMPQCDLFFEFEAK